MKTTTAFLLSALALDAAARSAPPAPMTFDAAPGASHPGLASDLAWLDGAKITGAISSAPEHVGVLSAPNFQVFFGRVASSVADPFDADREIDEMETLRLRLGTGLALSQVGLAGGGFDAALGVAYERDRIRLDEADVDGSRQWVDLSASVRAGSWRFGAGLAEAAVLDADSGLPDDPRLEARLGRVLADGTSWGTGLEIPLRPDGETGLRVGLGRAFRDAVEFQGELATSYARLENPLHGGKEWVRRSLELRLGTKLRFRPWVPLDDPSWLRPVVDPLGGVAQEGFLLRGWELGVSASWDLVGGKARPAVELSRSF